MCRKPPKPYYNKAVLFLLKLQHTQDRVPSKQAVFIFLVFWLKYFCCFNPKYFCSAPRPYLASPGILCTAPTDPVVSTGRFLVSSTLVYCYLDTSFISSLSVYIRSSKSVSNHCCSFPFLKQKFYNIISVLHLSLVL